MATYISGSPPGSPNYLIISRDVGSSSNLSGLDGIVHVGDVVSELNNAHVAIVIPGIIVVVDDGCTDGMDGTTTASVR